VILISSANAAALALRSGAADGPVFANLDVKGGTLAGCPCLASDALGDQLVALDGSRMLISDPGEVDAVVSNQASIEMADNPTNNSATPTGTTSVSMFQTDSSAIKVTRRISWDNTGPIAVVDSVNYLAEGGSPA